MPMLTRWLILASHQTVIMGECAALSSRRSAPVTTPPSWAVGMGQKQRGREVWRGALACPQVPGVVTLLFRHPGLAKVTEGVCTYPVPYVLAPPNCLAHNRRVLTVDMIMCTPDTVPEEEPQKT